MNASKKAARMMALYLVTFMLLCVACAGTATPGSPATDGTPDALVQPPAGGTDNERTSNLDNRQFVDFENAIEGVIPPNMSSYRYNPTLALGAMFEKVLKEDASVDSCASQNPDDFDLERIPNDVQTDGCEVQSVEPNQQSEARTVKGGASAKINHIVGSAGLDASFAFEFLVTTPLAASYPASQNCIDTVKVVEVPPSARTCEVYFVTGATLKQITFRQYKEVTGTASYNALVMVEGKTYGSEEYMKSLLVLTVDFISLSRYFSRDTAGYLVKPTIAEVPTVVEEIESMSPEEFIIAASLPPVDLTILPELSFDNLIADPALPFEFVPDE